MEQFAAPMEPDRQTFVLFRRTIAVNAAKPPAEATTTGGTRTRTPLAEQRILSPVRLPFRHGG